MRMGLFGYKIIDMSKLNIQKGGTMQQQLYKVKDAAKLLSVSEQWLYKRVKKGDIKSVKLGTRRAISIEEIERIKTEGVL